MSQHRGRGRGSFEVAHTVTEGWHRAGTGHTLLSSGAFLLLLLALAVATAESRSSWGTSSGGALFHCSQGAGAEGLDFHVSVGFFF